MKLTDRLQQWGAPHPFFTFEFFPPRTDQGFENLLSRIARLAPLGPLAITITWGAGGSTKDRSLDLAGFSQVEHGIDTVLHLTCTNMVQGTVDDALRSAKERGIQNVLALRGDPPRGSEYWIPTDPRFVHASDLVAYIRSHPEFGSHFCIGVAAYPDGHTDSKSSELDFQHLRTKVEAGADFIVTQLFYDVDNFLDWQKKVRAMGITIPIIPGVAPIQSYASFARMSKLCGTRVPPAVNDDQKVKDYGVELAIETCRRLTTEGGLGGVHFCTLNLEKGVRRVLEGLGWSHQSVQVVNKIIQESPSDTDNSHIPPDLVITASEASHLVERPTTPRSETGSIAPEPATASRGTWDDFPNGRFGDPNSPAFGALNPWDGGGLSVSDGIAQWGHPKSIPHLQNLFLSYLNSKIPTTPFSPETLSAESSSILPHLLQLTRRNWWTVASQPAVDASPSSDPIVGWGPRGGYVFQKAFVEFFCDKSGVEWLRKRVQERDSALITYYAANAKGDLLSNVSEETRNAVTWGVFPGQEIAQPTVIERDSFLAWKTEAFATWAQWAVFYPPYSEERRLLENVRNERWLVSVVHHDFKSPEALWTFLSEE
ncbi:hypothetical protein BS47DRAFT_1287077 [Hydnum rufescens UP504]|uniref:MTHFR SAM-binding regulatory domain-containing protein n=1 Tax=Hydnum rufescens UP504 TaxID=1448309 RepID=A0A9P6BD30_9AGAM|nr:hypothetical protein BS47DRAFT_1287077 [Hydnum rufescens UP504]